jgi:hypothetical protein
MWPTIIICAILAVIVGAIVRKMIKDKRANKGSCSCGCSGCPSASICHSSNRHG